MKKLTSLIIGALMFAPLAASAQTAFTFDPNILQQLLTQSTSTVSFKLNQLLQQYQIQNTVPWLTLTQPQIIDAVGKLETAIKDPKLVQAINAALATTTASSTATTISTLLAQVALLQAQIAALQQAQGAPVNPPAPPAPEIQLPQIPLNDAIQGLICPIIDHILARGAQGPDVTKLQEFLIRAGNLPAGNNTGFFGPLTEAAVQAWQAAKGIVIDGTPATTGWGVVGPKTRALLAQCNG